MKIASGTVQITKSKDSCTVSVHVNGTVSSLGVYKTLREAVEGPLANTTISPAVRSALEEIKKKCDDAGWKEEDVLKAFAPPKNEKT